MAWLRGPLIALTDRVLVPTLQLGTFPHLGAQAVEMPQLDVHLKLSRMELPSDLRVNARKCLPILTRSLLFYAQPKKRGRSLPRVQVGVA